MSLFDDFIKEFNKGFLYSNAYFSLDELKLHLKNKKFKLEKTGYNFIFYQKTPQLAWYFARENLVLKKGYYIKLLHKNHNFLQKEKTFLEQNNFYCFEEFKEMKKTNKGLKLRQAFQNEKNITIQELYAFLTRFFESEFLFFYDEKDLEQKYQNNEILILKRQNKLCGVLVFSHFLNSSTLDFIALDERYKEKYDALILLNAFFEVNKKANFFKLFVNIKNQRATRFYLKNDFAFTQTQLLFFKEKECN